MPKSLLNPSLSFDETNWVVSSCSYGVPGHAKIVVEGLTTDPASGGLRYFLGEYDIGYHPDHTDRYVIQCDSASFTEADYARALLPGSAGSAFQRLGLKAYYAGTTSRSNLISHEHALALIDNINQEEALNRQYYHVKTTDPDGLTAWTAAHRYEPIYAVLSPTEGEDTTKSRTNCATWINRKLRPYGLATSLPASSGGSVPCVTANPFSGYSTGKWLLGAAVLGVVAITAFWGSKSKPETPSLSLKRE